VLITKKMMKILIIFQRRSMGMLTDPTQLLFLTI